MVPRPKSTIMVPPWYHHEVPTFLLSRIVFHGMHAQQSEKVNLFVKVSGLLFRGHYTSRRK